MASFNFGNTSTLGANNQAAKPAAFGSFGFGSTPTSAAPAFGAPVSAAPAFGSSFGVPAASAAPTQFGFGSAATATTSVAPTFGGFGAQAPTASVAPTSSFGFGATNTTAGFGGFGAPPTSAAGTGIGGFGAPASGGFGGFGGGAFGAASSSAAPLLGGFGTTTTTSTAGGFGSFGSNFGKVGGGGFGQSAFGQPQQQQQQQQPFQMGQPQQQMLQQQPQQTAEEAFAQSILNVAIYGDERDAVIAKWNYLQAQWGSGKSYYTTQAAPLDITPENVLCRFKAMGYSKLPGHDNKLGYVALNIGRPADQVREQETQLADQLRQVFGSRPTIQVRVHTVRALSDTRSQAVIYVEERTAANTTDVKRIAATEVAAYLQQPQPKQLLTGMGVDQVLASVLPDDDQLKEYLETAPKGIDARMWRQAMHDNPDAAKLIPVPIIGFSELKWRIKCQETETETHTQYLQKVQRDVAELKQRHSSTVAKIMEHRRKFGDLAHRVLQIIVKQECSRKLGVSLTPEEEVLRSKFENMQALVSAPTQFKGRLSELLSQMRMQRNQWNTSNVTEYTLDKDATDEMKSFLSMQQKAMSFLIETVNKDMKSLRIISDGIKEIVRE